MKKDVSPVVMAIIIVVVVLVIGFFGWKMINREPQPVGPASGGTGGAAAGPRPGGGNAAQPVQATQ